MSPPFQRLLAQYTAETAGAMAGSYTEPPWTVILPSMIVHDRFMIVRDRFMIVCDRLVLPSLIVFAKAREDRFGRSGSLPTHAKSPCPDRSRGVDNALGVTTLRTTTAATREKRL